VYFHLCLYGLCESDSSSSKEHQSPNLSIIDLTRTFCAKGTCMIICGKSSLIEVNLFPEAQLTWSSTPESAYTVVSSRSLHGLITALACSGVTRLSPCTLDSISSKSDIFAKDYTMISQRVLTSLYRLAETGSTGLSR
jgi:hypothetical protein